MKVLLLSHGHPSFSIGGAEVASYNLFKGLGRMQGVDAHYLARIGPPFTPHRDTPFLSMGHSRRETLFFANDFDHFSLSNRDLGTLSLALNRLLNDVRPDVVHLHHVLGFGIEAIRAVRNALPNAKIVVTLHEYLAICNNHGQMVKVKNGALCQKASPAECGVCFPAIPPSTFLGRERFLKSFFDLVDAFVSPSRFLAERFIAWGIPAQRMHVIENGLEVEEIAVPRPLPGPGARRARFAYFGQLNPFKGIRVLMEAVIRMPAELWRSDAALYVFGGNLEVQPEAFQQDFKRLTTAAGRRVRFFGSYKSADLPRLMRDIDWVVVPSTWWENSPVVIQEAFLHGRPIIASDIGGMAEKIRDGIDGLHFRAGSAESLVDRMSEALDNTALWDRLHRRIRKPLTSDDTAARHFDLYNRIGQAVAPVAMAAE